MTPFRNIEDPQGVVDSIRGALHRLVVATMILYAILAVILVVAITVVILPTRDDATRTHDALCILRNDLTKRVEQSKAFLLDHPHGVAGIPASTIAEGVRNQQRTIDALSNLSCQADQALAKRR